MLDLMATPALMLANNALDDQRGRWLSERRVQEHEVLFSRLVQIWRDTILLKAFRARLGSSTVIARQPRILVAVQSGMILNEVSGIWVHLRHLHLTNIAEDSSAKFGVLE